MFDFDFDFSPFPGMNPYLEGPVNWSDFHSTFIHAMREAVNKQLPQTYFARVNEMVMMLGPESLERKVSEPDVFIGHDPDRRGSTRSRPAGVATLEPVTLAHVERLDPHKELFIDIIRMPEQDVVTVIELFSPTRKYGEGRTEYVKKRTQLPRSEANVVELDLLRRGQRLRLSKPIPPDDYYCFISRGDHRPYCDVYRWSMRDPMPALPIPLRPPDPPVVVDLAEPFKTAFARGLYGRFIDYAEAPPPPALPPDDAEWMAGILKSAQPSKES